MRSRERIHSMCLAMVVVMIFMTACTGQANDTPGESMQIATEDVLLDSRSYTPAAGYIANPYMGLCAWADSDPQDLKQDISLVYVDVTWAELEPEREQFDFEALEERCQIKLWKAMGLHAVFRLVLDQPEEEAHRDIPDWLYQITGDGKDYDVEYGKGYCPNYANEVLIHEHERVIRALAERYADDDFITFVELGSIGHWGEFHVHEDIALMPSTDICRKYYEPYLKYFSSKKLMLRRPYAFAKGTSPGLYNDSACLQDSTEDWLNWIQNGEEAAADDAAEAAEAVQAGTDDPEGNSQYVVPMPDAWKTAPIGGEISSHYETSDFAALVTEEKDRIKDLFTRSHTSWIGPNSFAKLDTSLSEEVKCGFEEVMQSVGYRLYVKQADVFADRIQIKFANAGSAPFYFDWDTVFRVCERDGTVYELTPEFDIGSVLPGEDQIVTIPCNKEPESLWVMVCSKDRSEALKLCNEGEELGDYRLIYTAQ